MQARTEEYARLLRRFSESELMEAFDDVVKVWEHPTWPPPGAFFTAAMQIRKEAIVPEHTKISEPPPRQLDLPHERVMAILDEYPTLSPMNRAALYKLGTGGIEMPLEALGDSLRMK